MEQIGALATPEQVAHCRIAMAERLLLAGETDEALETCRLALNTFELIAESRPDSVIARDSLVSALVDFSRILQAKQDFPAAREHLERAVSIRRELTKQAPAHVEAARAVAEAGKSTGVEPPLVIQAAEELRLRAIRELDELRGRGFFERPGYENLLEIDAFWQDMNVRDDFRRLKRLVAEGP